MTPRSLLVAAVTLLVPVSDEQAKQLFPGFKTVKPYLRTVAQPN